jgi:23S rRNA pseudouridine1911/1915/1917 synthase
MYRITKNGLMINYIDKLDENDYERIKRYKDFTVLECVLGTGRTHQIRVHLSSIGHHILGDKVYGESDKKFKENIQLIK